jgi:hypothetical protein
MTVLTETESGAGLFMAGPLVAGAVGLMPAFLSHMTETFRPIDTTTQKTRKLSTHTTGLGVDTPLEHCCLSCDKHGSWPRNQPLLMPTFSLSDLVQLAQHLPC